MNLRRPVIAVIGAGFSGLMTALNLMRQSQGRDVKIVLIERQEVVGLGAAYATTDPSHRLNVRAGNMSAWPDKPDDFLAWLEAGQINVEAGGFAVRSDYGGYLQDLLSSQIEAREAADRFVIVRDEVIAVQESYTGWIMILATGRPIMADAVVLALGNPRPHTPERIDPDLAAYVANPWRWDPSGLAPADRPIMMLGAGLSMVDTVLSLAGAALGRPLIALSRHGWPPLAHRKGSPSRLPARPSLPQSPVEALAWLRTTAAVQDWQAAVDAIRPVIQVLWRSWSLKQRASFLRHGRALWNVHRHRLSPEVAERLAQLRAEGSLRILAGRLEHVRPLPAGGLEVSWRPRGRRETQRFEVGLIVNCTGPSIDIERSVEPLVTAMAAQGLIRADPLRLGLDIAAGCRVVGMGGKPHPTLFAVGPLTQGALWEINAVPEIRVQAAEVAATALSAVGQTR